MTSREATRPLPWAASLLHDMPVEWLAVIGLLYAVSFILPVAFVNGRYVPGSLGVHFFQLVMDEEVGVLRLAHPALWCGLILLAARQWLSAGLAGAVATALAMYAGLILLAGNTCGNHASTGPGYGAWLLSAALLAGVGLSRFVDRLAPHPAATFLRVPLWGALCLLVCLLLYLGMIPIPYLQALAGLLLAPGNLAAMRAPPDLLSSLAIVLGLNWLILTFACLAVLVLAKSLLRLRQSRLIRNAVN